jgi:sec-independent protein translocase protein TatA
MANVGPMELVVVLIIVLVVLGPKRLPGIGSSLGKGMRDFKSALAGEYDPEGQAPEAKPELHQLPVADQRATGTTDPGAGDASPQSRDQVS